ncbi:hypothetical protein PPL_05955 [Heterostelium album PN500]|uniref:Uncharacterized protein n=1 Tax=Heterostelium pallidum (strain ATCC 26659 / Pp 5 / PN500) TaxID=670386 RepID=D3BBT6_HETP5|nr:hypothetical protein PPL_05955 [Heterostelium album PN500]EFA81119.1 hypothetical protein PPL_05955 [Heterostelium album PN500]|eukprot:XP_020433237.1 hypothetical protein PPL_05955 [Heterostelium album PN500]
MNRMNNNMNRMKTDINNSLTAINNLQNNITTVHNDMRTTANNTKANFNILNNNLETTHTNHHQTALSLHFNHRNVKIRKDNWDNNQNIQMGLHKTVEGLGIHPWYKDGYEQNNFGPANIGSVPVGIDDQDLFNNRNLSELEISQLSHWYNETFNINENDNRVQMNEKFRKWLTAVNFTPLHPPVHIQKLVAQVNHANQDLPAPNALPPLLAIPAIPAIPPTAILAIPDIPPTPAIPTFPAFKVLPLQAPGPTHHVFKSSL